MTTQEKIINVATQEFLNSGYLGASLRKNCQSSSCNNWSNVWIL